MAVIRWLPGGYVDATGPHRGQPVELHPLLTMHRMMFREIIMTGAELIAAERQRQMDVEGWTPEHDDEHGRGELINAASSYVIAAGIQVEYQLLEPAVRPPSSWPWEWLWWKPSTDPIRNLVKAGALIAAEIDRLQRAKSSTGKNP